MVLNYFLQVLHSTLELKGWSLSMHGSLLCISTFGCFHYVVNENRAEVWRKWQSKKRAIFESNHKEKIQNNRRNELQNIKFICLCKENLYVWRSTIMERLIEINQDFQFFSIIVENQRIPTILMGDLIICLLLVLSS